MELWRQKNRRRIRLIESREKRNLSERETIELEKLVSDHLKEVAPRSREVLDEFSEYIARMKIKIAVKNVIKL